MRNLLAANVAILVANIADLRGVEVYVSHGGNYHASRA
jgi:hypothetical protein